MAAASFSLMISSDPQYPWYDNTLPTGLTKESEKESNSERQIKEQYESMNSLADERIASAFPVRGVVVNGDLTAFGHGWQMDKYKELFGKLKLPFFPGLGNHDYENNVNDCSNNNCATRMVDYMYAWLKLNAGILNYDFTENSYYKFPELRVDYSGSLSYSLNLSKVHLVQLHNYPSYTKEWDSWNAGAARRDFYYIRPAFYWLMNDLAIARNRGDIIIVCLHDYHDKFVDPGLSEFNQIMKLYGVSAVFSGHIHSDCRLIGTIDGTSIPHFRSGSASFQDYLVADIDPEKKTMTVRKRACPWQGKYDFTGDQWAVALNDTIPYPPLVVPPKEGFVIFYNDGGFEAKFKLTYKYGVQEVTNETGKVLKTSKRKLYIPAFATDITVMGEENTGLVWEGWREVFNLKFPSAPNTCFRLYGTTLHPHWDNNCS